MTERRLNFGGDAGRSLDFTPAQTRRLDFGNGQGRALSFSGTGGGGPYASNIWGKIEGFANSAIETFPEMFGIEPSRGVQVFRARNPVSGFASQFLGMGGFYGGAAAAVERTPALAGLVTRAGSAFKAPWAQTAARWATEAAIIETGRLAVSATPLPEMVFGKERTQSLADMAGEGALNVALSAPLGAAVGAIRSALPQGVRVWDHVAEAHPSNPLVVRARGLAARVRQAEAEPGSVPDDTLAMLRNERDKLIRANLWDIRPTYTREGRARIDLSDPAVRRGTDAGRIVRPLVGDVPSRQGRQLSLTATLNRVFNYAYRRPGQLGTSRLLVEDAATGFASKAELDAAVAKIGVPLEEAALAGQDHRIFTFNTGTSERAAPRAAPTVGGESGRRLLQPDANAFVGQAARSATKFDARITGKNSVFTRMGDDFFVAREQDNGLFVVAKKINGRVGKGAAGDEWYFGRFDDLDAIAPQDATFRELTINNAAYWPKAVEQTNIGVGPWDAANRFAQEFGDILTMPQRVAQRLNPFAAKARDMAELAGSYVKPTAVLGGRSAKGAFALNLIKTLENLENKFVSDLIGGQRVLNPNQPLWRQTLSVRENTQAGFREAAERLSPDDWGHVADALEAQLPYATMEEFAKQGLIPPTAADFLRQLVRLDAGQLEAWTKLRDALPQGSPGLELMGKFSALDGHYVVSRARSGGFSAYIEDDAGKLVGWVKHDSPKQARDAALEIIKKEATRGRDLRFAGFDDQLLRTGEGYDRFVRAIREPGFIKRRGDVVGYDIQRDGLNADSFLKLLERNVRERQRVLTNVTLEQQLSPVLRELENEDAALAVQIRKRMAILQGDEGTVSRVINASVDRVLSPILGGSNWATQTSNGIQRLLSLFQFGFNFGHVAMQAVSIAQTIFPEAAYVMRGAARDLRDYMVVPTTDAAGRITGHVNVLSDIKLFASSMELLGKAPKDLPPDFRELVQEMTEQGLLAPRFSEAITGSQSSIIANALDGKNVSAGDWWHTLLAASEIMAAKSDEMTRMAAVATGYRLAKNLGIDEQFRMGRFVRDFLSKTTYNYGTIDRPAIFTNPIGSLAGTFKTWMFHYVAAMVKYGGEAKRGNVAPLLWQTAATAAVGGGVATPFFEPIANGFAKWATDQSFLDLMYNEWFDDNTQMADGIMYGLPGLAGVSLAAQASAPGADPARDASMLWSFAVWDRMKATGGAVSSAIDSYKATGRSPWEDENVRGQLARAVAPRVLYRALAAGEAGSIRSLQNGYRVIDDVSMGSALLYSLGFNPAELDRTYAAYGEVRQAEDKRRKMTAEMGRAMADALENGDHALATRVWTRALATGISSESVMRSAEARMKRGEQTQLEYSLGDDRRGEWSFLD